MRKAFTKYVFNDTVDYTLQELETDNKFKHYESNGTYYAELKSTKEAIKIQACSKARLLAKIIEYLDTKVNP